MTEDPRHISVLLEETMDVLRPGPGDNILDCTVGLGGHAAAFLERTAPDGAFTGIDADGENLERARIRLAPSGGRVALRHGNFRDLSAFEPGSFDIVFADLGLSSPHVDDAGRGFSFRSEALLDLRYDRSSGYPAASFLAWCREEDVEEALRLYGEIRGSLRLAAAIKRAAPATTSALRKTVESALGFRARKILPQVFQALRIAVNDEMNALNGLLNGAIALLRPGGRMGIIAYHSLEDRMVKQFFRDITTPPKDPVTGADSAPAAFELCTKKAVMPTDREVAANPRSRSARLRAIRKVVRPRS